MITQDFSLYKGETTSQLLTGDANTSGYTLTGQARPYYGYSNTGGLLIPLTLSGNANDVTVTFAANQTTGVPTMRWVYEIEGTSGDNTKKFFQGRITINPEVF